jgi:large subunit ribosomal protein L11
VAKKVSGKIKLQLPAGKANPAPPVGPALGQHGVNIMEFCKQYNAQTSDKGDQIIPVEITVYEDRSFSFVLKTPPVSFLIRKAAGIPKGSSKPSVDKAGSITRTQVEEIAKIKHQDTNAHELPSVMLMVEGAARSMGVAVVD